MQNVATQSLRKGLIEYDQRRGWRGPILNKKVTKSWNKDLEEYFLEKSLDWQIAIVKSINEYSVDIETINKKKGKIDSLGIAWTKKKI